MKPIFCSHLPTSLNTEVEVFKDGKSLGRRKVKPTPQNCRANVNNDISSIVKEYSTKGEVKFTHAECELIVNDFYNGNHIVKNELTTDLFDIIVGNTCVMFDDTKVKLKVGNFKIVDGLYNYCGISNFWWKNPRLSSLVMGLGRIAANIICHTSEVNDYISPILKEVKKEDLVKSIEKRDKKIAYKIYCSIEKYLLEFMGNCHGSIPISNQSHKEFHHFIKKGSDYFFKESPEKSWINNYLEGHGRGIENFLDNDVRDNMLSIPGGLKWLDFNVTNFIEKV